MDCVTRKRQLAFDERVANHHWSEEKSLTGSPFCVWIELTVLMQDAENLAVAKSEGAERRLSEDRQRGTG